MSQYTDFIRAFTQSSKAKQGLLENIIIDSQADGNEILITVLNSQGCSVSNDGNPVTTPLITRTDVKLDLSKVTKAYLAGLFFALAFDRYRALKVVKGEGDKLMEERNKRHLAHNMLSELIPILTGALPFSTLQTNAGILTSNIQPVTDAELAKLGIKRESLHSADWLRYGKTRTEPLIKLVFKYTVDNAAALKAIDAKLSNFPAYDDGGKRIPNSVSGAVDTKDCIVAYADFAVTDNVEFDI